MCAGVKIFGRPNVRWRFKVHCLYSFANVRLLRVGKGCHVIHIWSGLVGLVAIQTCGDVKLATIATLSLYHVCGVAKDYQVYRWIPLQLKEPFGNIRNEKEYAPY